MQRRVQRHHGDCLDPVRPGRLQLDPQRVQVRLAQHRPVRGHPLVEGDHPLRRRGRALDPPGEDVRPVLVADRQGVGEARGDDEGGPGAPALQQRVGGHRGAQADLVHRPRRDGRARRHVQQNPDPGHRGVGVPLRICGEQFVRDHGPVRAPADDVGERPAPVDPEPPAHSEHLHRVEEISQPRASAVSSVSVGNFSNTRVRSREVATMIQARNLRKKYSGVAAVDDLSFDVRPGVVTGFLGPNGAGKSTTIRLMLDLDTGSGETLFDGVPYRKLRQPLREVGYVSDVRAMHPGRRARTHLRMLAASQGINRKRVDEVMDWVGLSAVARKRPRAYSLGMVQRLGLAGRAARRPPDSDPRRAGQRAGPGRHPVAARLPQGLRRRGPHRVRLQPPAGRDVADGRPPRGHRPGPPDRRRARRRVHRPQLHRRPRAGPHPARRAAASPPGRGRRRRRPRRGLRAGRRRGRARADRRARLPQRHRHPRADAALRAAGGRVPRAHGPAAEPPGRRPDRRPDP